VFPVGYEINNYIVKYAPDARTWPSRLGESQELGQ
jgi:hypothetical protein